MSKRTVFIVTCLAVLCWVGLLVFTYNQQLHVVKTQRIITTNSDIDKRDCLVTAEDSEGNLFKAYADASACSVLVEGDVVKFEDGFVKE
jgi:hypothetical protein